MIFHVSILFAEKWSAHIGLNSDWPDFQFEPIQCWLLMFVGCSYQSLSLKVLLP